MDRIAILRIVLRPVVRFCLRRALTLQDIISAAKLELVAIAAEELEASGERVNVSRLSLITGVYRGEAHRIFKEKAPPTPTSENFLQRIVGQWEQNARFRKRPGVPKPLSFRGEASEFRLLCESVSKNINPGTVLYELTRLAMVQEREELLHLIRRESYLGRDESRAWTLFAAECESLHTVVEENTLGARHHHVRTWYDNVYVKDLAGLRMWLDEEGKRFHRKLRTRLAASDRDIAPGAKGGLEAGGFVSFSSFALVREQPMRWLPTPSEVDGDGS